MHHCVEFVDGSMGNFDAIILATGYKSNVPSWLKVCLFNVELMLIVVNILIDRWGIWDFLIMIFRARSGKRNVFRERGTAPQAIPKWMERWKWVVCSRLYKAWPARCVYWCKKNCTRHGASLESRGHRFHGLCSCITTTIMSPKWLHRRKKERKKSNETFMISWTSNEVSPLISASTEAGNIERQGHIIRVKSWGW